MKDADLPGLGCVAFWEKLLGSVQAYFFDMHFDIAAVLSLREKLTRPSRLVKLYILSGKDGLRDAVAEIEALQRNLNHNNPDIHYRVSQMDKRRYPFPHDRFAVTDGELWHFGGTVGSLEHCFTAVSRGWNDSDHGFEDFFKTAWRSLSSEEIK